MIHSLPAFIAQTNFVLFSQVCRLKGNRNFASFCGDHESCNHVKEFLFTEGWKKCPDAHTVVLSCVRNCLIKQV